MPTLEESLAPPDRAPHTAARAALPPSADADTRVPAGAIAPAAARADRRADGRNRRAAGMTVRSRSLAGLARALGGLALGAALAFGAAGSVAAGGVSSLQPHRAIYKVALGRAAGRSDVTAATGTMFYRFAEGCDGWTVENRTVLQLSYESGGDTETVWTFASWESNDGRKFRFYARYEQDGAQIERLEGRASIDAPGGGGAAEFTEPEGRITALPPGTLFPTEHLRALIAAADRGELRLTRVVFDGASIDNPYLVTAVMGPLPRGGRDALAAATRLPSVPAWWTQLAFFPYHQPHASPEFEIGAQYRADGIADRIVQRFDTFALDVRLSDFEALARPDC